MKATLFIKPSEQLLRAFPNLSTDEQFVIVRMLQVASEAVALDVSPSSPHKNTFKSLLSKGLLTLEQNNVKAPWAPYPWLFRNLHIWFYTNGEHPFTEK